MNNFIENIGNNESELCIEENDMKAAEKRIKEIMSELAEIERQRDSIISGINSDAFEETGNILRQLNRRESEFSDELEELRYKQSEYRRTKLREKSAVKLMEGLSPLYVYDEKVIAELVSKVEAVSKNEICLTFYGGYSVRQPITNNS